MRKTVSLFLAVIICLFSLQSCGGYELSAASTEVVSLLEGVKAFDSTGYNAAFRLNMTFEDGTMTLLFAQGNYEYNNGVLNAEMTQNVLGTPSKVTVNYENGISKTATDGEEMTEEISEEEFFSRLLYARPIYTESKYIEGADAVSTGEGNGYKVYLKNSYDLLFPYIGENIYSLTGLLKPAKNLTEIENSTIIYIVEDTKITGMTVDFTLVLYDELAYVPGEDVKYDSIEIECNYTVSFS